MDAHYLVAFADDLMAAALAGLDKTRTGIDPPGRRYLSHSRPVVDVCDASDGTGQLSVYLDASRPLVMTSSPAASLGRSTTVVPRQVLVAPVATYVIEWWRCHPAFTLGGAIPDAATLDSAAEMLLTDLWCLVQGLLAEHKAGTLVSVTCNSIEIASPTTLGPQGGAAGWTVPVRITCSDPP